MTETRKIIIVADSSSDVLSVNGIDYSVAPLKIISSDREFIDSPSLNVESMVNYFDSYKGKSKTSCPNVSDWIDAFGDADDVICVTITSALSGSYNSACNAKQIYEAEHEGRRVCIIDSLSAGPEIRLLIEKLGEYVKKGLDYEEICAKAKRYLGQTGLIFMLKSMKNLANNGRVSKASAKIAGFLGIHAVGKASDHGTLEPMDKCLGEENALKKLVSRLSELGFSGGKVRISHCLNERAAMLLEKLIFEKIPAAQIEIYKCRGLCSFYAEKGGMLIGFEKRPVLA